VFAGSRDKFQSFGYCNNDNCVYRGDSTWRVSDHRARPRAFSSLTIPVLMGPQTFADEDQIEYPADVITRAASSSSRGSPAAELVAPFLAERRFSSQLVNSRIDWPG